MAEYSVRILEAAARDLARLDKPVGIRVVRHINWLAENLGSVRLDTLTGDLAGLYKFRVGDYRVIFEVVWEKKILVIHAIGHRREIYRKR